MSKTTFKVVAASFSLAALSLTGFASSAQAFGVDLITNGSFELGTPDPAQEAAKGFTTIDAPNTTTIANWDVGAIGGTNPGVDWIGSYWEAGDLLRSVDMSGGHAASDDARGSLTQTILTPLVVGVQYLFTFKMSGNTDGPPLPIKTLDVQLGSGPAHTFTYDTSSSDIPTPMNWQLMSWVFTYVGGDPNTLTILSSGLGSAYGGAVDDAHLVATPIPPAVWLFGSGLLGIVALGRRRNQSKMISFAS